jgi:hypothetical protein
MHKTWWEATMEGNQPIRNKNYLWQPYLLTDRDEMSNLYRGPTIDASYQVAVPTKTKLGGKQLWKALYIKFPQSRMKGE